MTILLEAINNIVTNFMQTSLHSTTIYFASIDKHSSCSFNSLKSERLPIGTDNAVISDASRSRFSHRSFFFLHYLPLTYHRDAT